MNNIKGAIENILSIILSVGFLGAGMIKLVGMQQVENAFLVWNYPSHFMYIVGAFEMLLFVGFFIKKFRSFASIGAIILMTGAIYTHIHFGESNQLYGPLLILILATAVLFLGLLNNKKSSLP